MHEELITFMAEVRAAGYDPYVVINTALALGSDHREWLAPTLRDGLPNAPESLIRRAWIVCSCLIDSNIYSLPEGY